MYSYILVGALTELLPASGIEASRANVGLYGGLLFSIFMLGWACSMVWGWAADRYGRVRIMCWTVLVYSVFTALCGLSTGIIMFGPVPLRRRLRHRRRMGGRYAAAG